MTADEIRQRTQGVWDRFYALPQDLGALASASSRCKARLAFVLISKLYRQMYANTGIATDSARTARSVRDRPVAGQAVPAAVRRQAHAPSAGTGGSGTGGSGVDRQSVPSETRVTPTTAPRTYSSRRRSPGSILCGAASGPTLATVVGPSGSSASAK